MGLMFTTVIGFMVCMGITAGFIMHFLTSVMPATDSSVIDPKIESNF
ncbi:hypothetical protein ACXYMX_10300 [Sporosarcina sp. CAU 1771]